MILCSEKSRNALVFLLLCTVYEVLIYLILFLATLGPLSISTEYCANTRLKVESNYFFFVNVAAEGGGKTLHIKSECA